MALKPYSPVLVEGERDGLGNLSLQWVRRTRIDGNWKDWVDVPLNEVVEAYEVDIMDGDTVTRSLLGLTTAGANYSVAQQVEDFGSVQSNIAVRVYQVSGLVGRGYGAEAVV